MIAGISIGVFGFVLILGIIMDILGKEKCLHLLNINWLQWGTFGSIASYVITIAGLLLSIFAAFFV